MSETAAAGGDPGLNVEPLIERSPAGIVRVALDGRVLYANPAAARLLGFETAAELLAHNAAEFCPGPTPAPCWPG